MTLEVQDFVTLGCRDASIREGQELCPAFVLLLDEEHLRDVCNTPLLKSGLLHSTRALRDIGTETG
jgi:hypothetical protein